jgi:YD repeat-containing protein
LENLNGRLVGSIAGSAGGYHASNRFVTDLFSYDDEGRIKLKIKMVPGMPKQYIFYAYDLHGKVLTETTDCGTEHIVKQYNYDSEGRLINVVHVNNENKVLVSYDYDGLSRLETKTLPIGGTHTVNYVYDIRERIESLASPAGVKGFTEDRIAYDLNGNIASAHYYYDHQGAAPNTSMIHLDYLYDGVNRLTDVIPGVDHSVSIPSNGTFQYDVIGRIKYKEEGTDIKPGYRYYSGTNRLRNTQDDDDLQAYYYDKNGNMVVDVAKKMVIEYDWRDMPVAFRFYDALPGTLPWDNSKGTFTGDPKTYVEANGGTLVSQVVMLYDASGNRVLKMEGK